MPLKALLIPENQNDCDSDGIGGGTGCNFIFFMYLCIYFSEFTLLATPLDIFSSNFVCRSVSTV